MTLEEIINERLRNADRMVEEGKSQHNKEKVKMWAQIRKELQLIIKNASLNWEF